MGKIDLVKAMRTFLLVVEKGSFSAASRELSLVTSAISKQVSDLEKHFSTQLLYRSTRAMRLTSEGEFYAKQFQEITSRVDDLESISDHRQHTIAGKVRISAPVDSESLGILKNSSDFIKKHPEVRMSWLFVNRFVNMVEEGIDLSVRIGPLPDSNLIARHYGSTAIHYVASPEYIKKHGTPNHPNELKTHQCILDTSNREPKRWRYCDKGTKSHVQLKAFLEVNDGKTAAKFSADGHGIAFLPTFLIKSYLDNGQLIPILRGFEFESSPVSLVFPAYHLTNPTLKVLVDYLIEHRPEKI
jgi:DNA-binding transcriptional LysR family regulator